MNGGSVIYVYDDQQNTVAQTNGGALTDFNNVTLAYTLENGWSVVIVGSGAVGSGTITL